MRPKAGVVLVMISMLASVAGAGAASTKPTKPTKPTQTAKAPAPTASTPTAEELLDRYAKAIGGRDKLKAIKTMRMHGTMAGSGGFTSSYLLELKRPNLVRTEFTFNGTTAIQATDGTTGWTVMPPPGKPVAPPTPMSPRQIQDLQQAADIDGRLLDAKAKGFQVELVGKESVGTAAAWNLKLTDVEGVVRNFYLDATTYLPIMEAVQKKVDGKLLESEMHLSDYRELSGLKFPYLLESSIKNTSGSQRLVLDKIELNPEIAADRFGMPAAPPKSSAKDASGSQAPRDEQQ